MEPRYGPPPDPREILVAAGPLDQPLAWAFCLLVGVLLMGLGYRRRWPLLFCLGGVVGLSAPWLFYTADYVFGAYPTVDKAGSLAFYLDGVQWRLLEATDPGMRLIGVHVGHLWVTAAFDLLLPAFAAFNAQALLNLTLAWYCAHRLFRALGARGDSSLFLAFFFAMNLHQFRDINWYTIEKTAIFWLPLYGLSLWRAWQGDRRWMVGSGLLFGLAFFMNAYWALLCGGLAAAALLVGSAVAWRRPELRPQWKVLGGAFFFSVLGGLPLAWLQWRLMHGEASLGSPEAFAERASLDVLSLWPPAWNRLELWRVLDPLALGLVFLSLRERKVQWLWGLMLPFLVLSLGPTRNPLYFLCNLLIPGFWRLAKPETFFHLAWLLLLGAGAVAWRRPQPRLLPLLAVLSWLLLVRLHPVYPGLARPIEVGLAPGWQQILGMPATAPGPRDPPAPAKEGR
jgi:hypothetical protein